MDFSMEDVIKNIIHIDKSADELKRNFDKEIEERKRKVKDEIEKLRIEIVENEIKKIKEHEKREIESALNDAFNIKSEAYNVCSILQKKFESNKDILIKEIFDGIFK